MDSLPLPPDGDELPSPTDEPELQTIESFELVEASPEETSTGSESQAEKERILQTLLQEMQELRQDFETKVQYDESKERLVDSLHRELQVYREGLHFRVLRPVFVDLIALHDDLDKLIESMPVAETNQVFLQTRANYLSFQETIEDILQRNGVELYQIDGDVYFPGKQRVLQTIDAPDPEKDKKIAYRIRKGFAYEDRVLRPELVVTYRSTQGRE